ncbi:MAG: serine--tRNA ligase [Thermodesulfobacteriota bacterium]|nr:serine--tRNA ligase [Thermodesulfobacteriota bacterium]
MLDLKFIRKNLNTVREALGDRGSDLDLGEFSRLDVKRRELLQEVEALKAERNKTAAEIAACKREGRDAGALIEKGKKANERIKDLDARLRDVDARVDDWLFSVPNIPHQSVPRGKDENDNPVLHTWGEKPVFDFKPREHWDLGVRLGGLDFERSAKLTGSRFAVYWGWAAKLERALISFMLDLQTGEHGYTEVMPPAIVNRDSMTATGQLPKFAEDLFKLEGCEYFLIPTAEVPVTNLHRDELLQETDLPLRYASYTPCFRSEAGSYGKDVKGLVRQHQFNKVELVRFERPGDSYAALEELLKHAEAVLQKLGLHYRVVELCTGDLGFSAAKTYDVEVWLPGQGKYREISSCSNFEDFQARRANIRFKPQGSKKAVFAHTLNGSGLAVGRTVVAILENLQQKQGSVVVPEVLRPYMNGLEVIENPA